MHSPIRHNPLRDLSNICSEKESLSQDAQFASEQLNSIAQRPFQFETHFQGCMGMYGDPQDVAEYLNAHEGWFCRCAKPMTAEPLGENGYTLTIGRFGSFGYEVEPKMGVVLLPPQQGLYVMHSVPVPGYTPSGYSVNYWADMRLVEIPPEEVSWATFPKKSASFKIPSKLTQVEWQLNLKVTVEFPKFIYKLSPALIQTTGDRLLSQIVRQISPRLTHKVQKDFHRRLGLPIPPKQSRQLSAIGH